MGKIFSIESEGGWYRIMQALEKILEEIKEATFQEDAPIYSGDMEVDGYVKESVVKEIIRSHMDEVDDDWIPVEERLPEETTGRYYPEMNVTTSYGVVTWGFYRVRDKQWYIYSKIYNEFVETKDKEVIAWQPLPESYKPKE